MRTKYALVHISGRRMHFDEEDKQENRWKRRMLPKWILSIKGRTCNPTPLVHQDMIKKTTFFNEKIRRDNSSKM